MSLHIFALIFVKLMNCFVDTLIREFKAGSPALQQSLAMLLGVLDYSAHPHGLSEAIKCLMDSVDPSVSQRFGIDIHDLISGHSR